jgi:hypothetical protein
MTPVDLQTLVMNGTTLQPVITKKAGWPKTLRLGSRGKTTLKYQPICCYCGKKGHNIRTCDRRQKHFQALALVQLPNAPLFPLIPAKDISQEL